MNLLKKWTRIRMGILIAMNGRLWVRKLWTYSLWADLNALFTVNRIKKTIPMAGHHVSEVRLYLRTPDSLRILSTSSRPRKSSRCMILTATNPMSSYKRLGNQDHLYQPYVFSLHPSFSNQRSHPSLSFGRSFSDSSSILQTRQIHR